MKIINFEAMRKEIEKILKEYKAYETGGLTHATNELLDLFSVRQRFYNWMQKVNEKYEILMIWWRYDNEGTPHKIGWRLFGGKLHIRYRNVA